MHCDFVDCAEKDSFGIGTLSNHLAKDDETLGIEAMASCMSLIPHHCFTACFSNSQVTSPKKRLGKSVHSVFC